MKSLSISIVVFTTDPGQWKNLAQSLLSNKTEFEVITVGPNTGRTPPDFRHIRTDVKPVQCYELGFRKASGRMLVWCADYMRFCPGALDRACLSFKSGQDRKKVVFFNTEENASNVTPEQLLSNRDLHPLNVLLPGMINRDLLLSLGGLDKKFVCCHAEKDLAMRIGECGGALEICQDARVTAENAENADSFHIFKSSSKYDMSVLRNLWADGNRVNKKRNVPLEAFNEDTLLSGSIMQENRDSISSLSTVTQGPSGNWYRSWWKATRGNIKTIPQFVQQQPVAAPNILYKSSIQEPELSIILTDWSCSRSLDTVDLLNDQSISRKRYEIIWVEYHSNVLPEINKMVEKSLKEKMHPVLDQWIEIGVPDNICFHRHLMYNIGILTSRGRIICICDTHSCDRLFAESIIHCFNSNRNIVLCINATEEWSCMCALRGDLIEIGGADEHRDFLGYCGGPYDMVIRLSNAGKEKVLPAFSGGIETIQQPYTGLNLPPASQDALTTRRTLPLEENPSIKACRIGLESYALQHDYNSRKWAVE